MAAAVSRAFVALGALLALGGCAFNIPIRPSLEGSRWQVVRINGQDVPRTPDYQVEFAGGQFGGKLGCNRFGGSYVLGAETITVGPIAATKMACMGRAMSDEQAGFAAMALPLRIFWTDLGARLVLTSPNGSLDLRKIG